MSKGKPIWVDETTIIKLDAMKVIPKEPYTDVLERLFTENRKLKEELKVLREAQK